MSRKQTSRVRKQATGPRGVNLRAKSGKVMWCQTKKSSRRFVRVGIFLLVLLGALWGGQAVVQQVFLDSEEFALVRVDLWQWELDEVPSLVDHSRLHKTTGLVPGVSIFAFHLGEIEDQLEALPEVKRAHATRRFPNVLRIRVEERVPLAWVDSPRQRIVAKDLKRGMLVDAGGFCFAPSSAMKEAVAGLPVITTGERGEFDLISGQKAEGREFYRALELVKMSQRYLSDAGWSLPVVGLRNEFSLLAKTHTGTVVTFGLYEHERQLEDLLLILNHARQSSRGVASINLIPERNIPIVFASVGAPVTEPASLLESNLEAILTRG